MGKKLRTDHAAKAVEAQDLVKKEMLLRKEKQQQLLAERRKLKKKESEVRRVHAHEEVKMELEHEQQSLKARPVAKMKAKNLLKDLNKVNGIIASLQGQPENPDA